MHLKNLIMFVMIGVEARRAERWFVMFVFSFCGILNIFFFLFCFLSYFSLPSLLYLADSSPRSNASQRLIPTVLLTFQPNSCNWCWELPILQLVFSILVLTVVISLPGSDFVCLYLHLLFYFSFSQTLLSLPSLTLHTYRLLPAMRACWDLFFMSLLVSN